MPAIKANAYGHGVNIIGKALQDIGIDTGMHRLGIALYGVFSSSHDKVVSKINMKPVLSLKARI